MNSVKIQLTQSCHNKRGNGKILSGDPKDSPDYFKSTVMDKINSVGKDIVTPYSPNLDIKAVVFVDEDDGVPARVQGGGVPLAVHHGQEQPGKLRHDHLPLQIHRCHDPNCFQ